MTSPRARFGRKPALIDSPGNTHHKNVKKHAKVALRRLETVRVREEAEDLRLGGVTFRHRGICAADLRASREFLALLWRQFVSRMRRRPQKWHWGCGKAPETPKTACVAGGITAAASWRVVHKHAIFQRHTAHSHHPSTVPESTQHGGYDGAVSTSKHATSGAKWPPPAATHLQFAAVVVKAAAGTLLRACGENGGCGGGRRRRAAGKGRPRHCGPHVLQFPEQHRFGAYWTAMSIQKGNLPNGPPDVSFHQTGVVFGAHCAHFAAK